MTGDRPIPGLREEPATFLPGAMGVREDMFDVVNLPRQDTGITGVVFVSIAQGSHGPRVKWYPGRPGRNAPCLTQTIEATPRVINLGLPERDARLAGGEVARWVAMNREALPRFWRDGLSWTRGEVDAVVEGLAKLP